MKDGKKDIKWYESGNMITTLIIVTILATILCSQSFAVVGNSSFSLFSSVINHNSVYLLVLVYFCLLKTKMGKVYFNYLNIFLIFIYFISTLTTFLTLIQSFSLNTIFHFLESFVLFVYLFHTMLRDTRVWKDMHLGKSPFNEIVNDYYFYALLVLVVFSLVVNLISTVVVSGLFVSILDAFYVLLFARYIYLYHEYLDYHKLDSDNSGNFDEIYQDISNDIQSVLDKTDLDEKVVDISKKVKEKAEEITDKVKDKSDEIGEKVKDKVDEHLKKDEDDSIEKKEKKREKKKGND